jgi:integrase
MAKVAKRRERYVLDFYDQTGKRIWKTLPKGTTKKIAQDELNKILETLKITTYIPDRKIPKFKDVAKEWLEHKKLNLRSSTWSVYEGHTRNHFSEFLDLKINQINTKMIEQYIYLRQSEGMNISTLKKVLVSLGQIFALAVKRGYCVKNPIIEADRPRTQGTENEEADKIKILKPIEISAFLNQAQNQKYKMLFTLAVFSGARQGELLGLKWSDIDWENNQIHIQRTFNNGAFFMTKTSEGNRKIDIGPTTMKALKKWKLACLPGELDLVFPTEKGTPMNHNNMVARYFRRALKLADLEQIRFHDLRHTYASLLIEQGENIKYIQTQLGHSNPTVTLNVYAHLMKPTNQESALKLEQKIY